MGQPALSESTVLVDDLLDCEQELVLLKKDDIKSYPFWARWLLYFTYWITNYDGEIQLQSICTTEDRARELAESASEGGYRAIWVPVDEMLPEERCQWRPAIHFNSPFQDRYRKYWPRLMALPRKEVLRELNAANSSIERLETIAKL